MRTRLGLKVLGLSALVMGVMAVGTAGVAHAEEGACWSYLISGVEKCFGEGGLEPRPVLAVENNTATLLIENLNFEVLCTGAEFDEGGQLALNGAILLGRIKFSGCIGLSRTPTLSKLAACTPNDPTTGLGTILTEKGEGLIVLHNGEPVVLLKDDDPIAGHENLAKIFMSEECSVGEELIVKGELVIADCPIRNEKGEVIKTSKEQFEEHKLVHLIEEFPALQLMKVGTNKATIDGSANVTLPGDHNTLPWGGKPA